MADLSPTMRRVLERVHAAGQGGVYLAGHMRIHISAAAHALERRGLVVRQTGGCYVATEAGAALIDNTAVQLARNSDAHVQTNQVPPVRNPRSPLQQ